MLDRRHEVFLNAVAQGKASREQAATWFVRLPQDGQLEAIRWVYQAAAQAGAMESDIPLAITTSGIRPTVSAATALSAGRLKVQVNKLLHMKGKDATHAFGILLALFTLADERRRNSLCKNGCTHWWHNIDAEWALVRQELNRQSH